MKNKPPFKLIIILGAPAVGKMAVAQSIAKITNYKVFHNHMTIDLLTKLFPFNSEPYSVLVKEFRSRIIEESIKNHLFPGLIFTYVWNLDSPSCKAEIDHYKRIVESAKGEVFFLELTADLEERLKRNKSENRLKNKNKSKVKKTEETLLDWEKRFRLSSNNDFFYPKIHLKVDNTLLSPDELATLYFKK